MRSIPISILLTTTLFGCAATAPQFAPNLPQVPRQFREEAARSTALAAPQPGRAWWKAFDDPLLDNLMESASRNNSSIHLAGAQLAKARALVRTTGANRWPQLVVGASTSRQGGPLENAAGSNGTLITLAGAASYETDLFGRLANESDAASLDAAARESLLRSTRLLVQTEVAQTYFMLRGLDAERALVRASVSAYRESLRLTERKVAAGYVAELDLARLRAESAAVESEALTLDRRRAELEHALAVLAGQVASNMQVTVSDWKAALPVIPAGVPSKVLTRRPDISAAQHTMQAALARVGIAKSAWFPNLTLTASGGYASPDLRDLLSASTRAWGIGALLSLPLLDGGRREAAVQGANADLETSAAAYREKILIAFKEVEDHLSSLRIMADQSEVQARAVAAATQASTLSNSRYQSGFASQLDFLDARRSELHNRRQALQLRALQYQSTVGLIRALGGGWGSEPMGRHSGPQPPIASAKS